MTTLLLSVPPPATRRGKPVREVINHPRWWCPACGRRALSGRVHCRGSRPLPMSAALHALINDQAEERGGSWSGKLGELDHALRHGEPWLCARAQRLEDEARELVEQAAWQQREVGS